MNFTDTNLMLDIDPDADLWVEACIACEASDNHGNAWCAACDDLM